MKNNHSIIGGLLIAGAIALFIPYTLLTIIFEYPDVLRQDTSVILTKFYEGGSSLIWTWFAFAITGMPLLPAYILIGHTFGSNSSMVRIATNIGVIGLIVQMVGLLRWTFVVPVLADAFVHATDEATQASAIMAFKTIHQFGGVILGEYLGQLFTIAWTVLISIELVRIHKIPVWMGWFGGISSFIYLLAQAELFATVLPEFPVWDMAGFIGSTLWLIWLILLGVIFLKRRGDIIRL